MLRTMRSGHCTRWWLLGVVLFACRPTICVAEAPRFLAGTPRSTVPVLCTDNYLAARTHARGSAVIVDANGLILTAAHVVLEHQQNCDLTVLVPDDDWSKALGFWTYSVRDCATDAELDLALCHIAAIGKRPLRVLRAASLQARVQAPPGEVTITGFAGWGLLPLSRRGALQVGNFFRRQENCHCDFSMGVAAVAGMSGGPVTTDRGEVIGIVTAFGTGRFQGMSFAVSIERARPFLKRHGVALP